MSEVITIARGYNGPADSGNGGYVCGLLAMRLGGPVSVSLRMPPPLETPLPVSRDGDQVLLKLEDGTLVAQAEPAQIDMEVPPCPSYNEVVAAQPSYAGFVFHGLPTCFVCGPARKEGDGLRIFASPIKGKEIVAASWTPDNRLAADGIVADEFVWAALDCPGYFAVINALGSKGEKILTGRMTTSLEKPVRAGEPYVVMGWQIRSDGRKHWAGTAVFTADGEIAARAEALWIKPRGVD